MIPGGGALRRRAAVEVRRLPAVLVLAVMALVASAAGHAAPMGEDDARHLLNRTGFGAAPAEIAAFARLSRTEAVDRLLGAAPTQAKTPPPAWVNELWTSPRVFRALSDEERKAHIQREIRRGLDLRGWWIGEMIETPAPLLERMTLFWHNHFVSSQQKVRSGQLMYRQNVLLRQHALGNFGALLHAVSKDPAMVIYLDAATNRKGKPNENFAREVMELFTLGEGHYTEADVREAARAFTGWSIEPDTGEFRFRPQQHETGTKVVLGRSGDFNGDAVLDVLLAQPATAEFIAAKLMREFVSPEPDPREVKRVAARFRESRYDIRAALRALLASEAFWAPAQRGVLIKSPVELVVGTMRTFDLAMEDPVPLALVTAGLGQNLMAPPNVRGWPGGEAWINSSTLLARRQFTERVFRADEPRMAVTAATARGADDRDLLRGRGVGAMGPDGRARMGQAFAAIRFDGEAWGRELGRVPTTPDIERLVLALPPVSALPAEGNVRERVRAATLDPVYQLK